MEPQVNTKSGTRYKTAPEIELKSLRKTLTQVRAAVLKWQNELFDRYEGSEADEISQRYASAIVREIDRVS